MKTSKLYHDVLEELQDHPDYQQEKVLGFNGILTPPGTEVFRGIGAKGVIKVENDLEGSGVRIRYGESLSVKENGKNELIDLYPGPVHTQGERTMADEVIVNEGFELYRGEDRDRAFQVLDSILESSTPVQGYSNPEP